MSFSAWFKRNVFGYMARTEECKDALAAAFKAGTYYGRKLEQAKQSRSKT